MQFRRLVLILALLLGTQAPRVAEAGGAASRKAGVTRATSDRLVKARRQTKVKRAARFLSVGPSKRELFELRRVAKKMGVKIETFGDLPRDSADVDVNGLIASAVEAYAGKKGIAGVVGTDDLGSMVASVINDKLGKRGATSNSVFRTQHKFLSRQAQERAVLARHLPRFRLVALDAKGPPKGMKFPFFLKPVKAHLSILASQINNQAELEAALADARRSLRNVTTPFEDIRVAHTDVDLSVNYMIAEELIKGDQVTVEGFVHGGKATALGVVDSVMYPGTRSFKRFDYPSRHSPRVQRKMNQIATAVAEELGLDNTMFNIEMSFDRATGDIKIIEINPRPSSQFAPLFEAVDGTNSYEIQLRLASGKKPSFVHGQGPHKVATSFVMRTFQDQQVVRSPTETEITEILDRNPDMRIESFARPGGKLSDMSNDPESFRWAIVTLGGKSEAHMQQRLKSTLDRLPFELKPVGETK